jgi:hypothetical protein
MAAEIGYARTAHDVVSSSLLRNKNPRVGLFLCSFRIKACHSMSNNNKDIYKQVGLFQNAVFLCVRACTSCFLLFMSLMKFCLVLHFCGYTLLLYRSENGKVGKGRVGFEDFVLFLYSELSALCMD